MNHLAIAAALSLLAVACSRVGFDAEGALTIDDSGAADATSGDGEGSATSGDGAGPSDGEGPADEGGQTGGDAAGEDVPPIPDGAECAVDEHCTQPQNPCRRSACEDGTCVNRGAQDGTLCEDGDPCTLNACISGQCQGIPRPCDDGDPCTQNVCDNGDCLNPKMECGDDNPCTSDHCEAGVGCVNEPMTCDDGIDCTFDGCNPLDENGCVNVPRDIACADGLACSTDVCVPDVGCQSDVSTCSCVEDVDCQGPDGSNNACVTPKCKDGACVAEPVEIGSTCSDGNPCTVGDTCGEGGTCLPGSVCPDEDETDCMTPVCSVADATGNAVACQLVAEDCDDDDPCTTDSCSAGQGCVHVKDVCDDGLACTIDTCNPTTGACTNTPEGCACVEALTDCEGITVGPCQSVICNASYECEVVAKSAGDDCTTEGQNNCQQGYCDHQGQCVTFPKVCPNVDGNPCTLEQCDLDSGDCVQMANPCSDGNPCTMDVCKEATGCDNPPIPCGDDDPCTLDFCDSEGTCQHPPKCVDSDPCTIDLCDALEGGFCDFMLIPECPF